MFGTSNNSQPYLSPMYFSDEECNVIYQAETEKSSFEKQATGTTFTPTTAQFTTQKIDSSLPLIVNRPQQPKSTPFVKTRVPNRWNVPRSTENKFSYGKFKNIVNVKTQVIATDPVGVKPADTLRKVCHFCLKEFVGKLESGPCGVDTLCHIDSKNYNEIKKQKGEAVANNEYDCNLFCNITLKQLPDFS